jgi:hypothetical protein
MFDRKICVESDSKLNSQKIMEVKELKLRTSKRCCGWYGLVTPRNQFHKHLLETNEAKRRNTEIKGICKSFMEGILRNITGMIIRLFFFTGKTRILENLRKKWRYF